MKRTNDDQVKRIALELSLKPFGMNDGRSYEACARQIISAWRPLLDAAEEVSFMLWVADGSEILEWNGSLEQSLEWACYIGFCNSSYGVYNETHHDPGRDAILYTSIPKEMQYVDLKNIVNALRFVGTEMLDRKVTVGSTFDPGPEFAESPFKYVKHPEIIVPKRLNGRPTFPMVDAASVLHADSHSYAAYPDGIPEGEPFAMFLGRQITAYCRDLGFDYVWLSNGFGFSAVAWSFLGPAFDGESFYPEERESRLQKFKQAWQDLYTGNPDFPMEVRGSNFAAGMDIAKDGVDFIWLYDTGYIRLPPPNSPWGALNFDYGLEIAGYLSRVVKSPRDEYLFRYYPNDPWFWQNPWTDVFYGQAFDIYLPFATSVINANGKVITPSTINILTGDTEFGETDPLTGVQVASHIRTALSTRPDDAGLITWVYPFNEYHNLSSTSAEGLAEVFFGDWYVRSLINNGLPVSTIATPEAFDTFVDSRDGVVETIVLLPTAAVHTLEDTQKLLNWLEMGIPAILYGPAVSLHASIRDVLGIELKEALSGELHLAQSSGVDAVLIYHDPAGSAGGISAHIPSSEPKGNVEQIYQVYSPKGKRSFCVMVEVNGVTLTWLRGTNPFETKPDKSHLSTKPVSQPAHYFDTGKLGSEILGNLGYSIDVLCEADNKDTLMLFSRHDNAWYLNGYAASPAGDVKIRFPDGAPIFHTTYTRLKNGASTYPLSRVMRYECRVFVQQGEGVIGCDPRARDENHKELTLRLTGLKDAVVVFHPPERHRVTFENEGNITHFDPGETKLTTPNLSGELLIRW
jgi:hypothetical protein